MLWKKYNALGHLGLHLVNFIYPKIIFRQGSLDGTVLSSVIATILHLFLWIVVWLFLTVKQSWTFKLRVTVGRAAVR